MLVTPVGIVMRVRLLHPENALSLMSVRLALRVTLVRPLQP